MKELGEEYEREIAEGVAPGEDDAGTPRWTRWTLKRCSTRTTAMMTITRRRTTTARTPTRLAWTSSCASGKALD